MGNIICIEFAHEGCQLDPFNFVVFNRNNDFEGSSLIIQDRHAIKDLYDDIG